MKQRVLKVKLPDYTSGEELANSLTHGLGAVFGIVALVLMVNKAATPREEMLTALFGASIIITYSLSCVYHGLPKHILAKKVMRIMDHCGVFILVYGTLIPCVLLGLPAKPGWTMFSLVGLVTLIGIVLTVLNIDGFAVPAIICHLLNGWSILFVRKYLLESMGHAGFTFMLLGGIFYTVGSILYGVGKKVRYIHAVFHVLTLLGTFFHFWGIYMYLI